MTNLSFPQFFDISILFLASNPFSRIYHKHKATKLQKNPKMSFISTLLNMLRIGQVLPL